MFAGAAFTDAADISRSEAVDMLSALGVIKGYSDGSFKPDATITRAEAAKMIYTIRNGGNDNADTFKGKSNFTDVYSGHWAEGYINFCYTNGIINGKSATKFAPEESVTGTELAKMLLICMGYQAEKSGLTGSGYSQRTNALASENGLLDDVTAAMGVAFPRQYAAQMMYNALDAETVTWSTDVNDYKKTETTGLESREVAWDANGKALQIQYVSVTKNETMGKKWMGLDKIEDVYLTGIEKEDGKDTYRLNDGEYTKVAGDYSHLLGQYVNVLIKDNDRSKVYGVYATGDSKVLATGTVGQLEDTSAANKTKLNGTEYKLENKGGTASSVTYSETQPENKTVLMPNSSDTFKVSELEDATTIDKVGGTIKLIDNNGNGKADVVLYTPAPVGQLTYVGSKSITINNSIGSKDLDDIDIYEGYAKDDWVTYTPDTYTISGDAAIVKVNIVTAEVTSKKSGTPDEVRVDGTWYKVATDQKGDSIDTGSTYDLAIVGNYIVNADETEASSTDLVFVSDFAGTNDGFQNASTTQDVKAYFMNGSSKTITVEKAQLNTEDKLTDIDKNHKLGASDINKLYTYSAKSNGNYELKLLNNGKNKAGYETVGTAANVDKNQKIDGKSVDDAAVVFVTYPKTGDNNKVEVKVITGKTLNNWNKAYGTSVMYATKKSNGIEYVKVAAVSAENSYAGIGSDYLYGYMLSDSYDDRRNGDDVTAYEIWTGTEEITVYVDGNGGAKMDAGDVLVYSLDGDFINVENNSSDIAKATVAITGIQRKSEGDVAFVTTGGVSNTYSMNEDCVFIAMNDDKQEKVEGSSLDQIALAEEISNGKYYANAYIYYNTDDDHEIVAIIYDADNNRLDGEPTATK